MLIEKSSKLPARRRWLFALTAVALFAAGSGTAQAFDFDVDVGFRAAVRKVFNKEHRVSVRRYLLERHDDCPQGLENKEGVCTPQHAERLWLIGKPLAASVQVVPVPPALAASLPMLANGNAYGFVNGDVVLYRTDTRMVIDAVVWSS